MFQNFLTRETLYVTMSSRSSEQTENRRRQMTSGHRPNEKTKMSESSGKEGAFIMKNTKRSKRVAAFAAAVMMVACAAVPMGSMTASAADYTITISDTTAGHSYEAYQIFKGTLADGVLGNIEWGSGVDTTKTVTDKTLLDAIKAIKLNDSTTPFADCATANDVATKLAAAADAATKAGTTTDDLEITKKFAAVVGDYLSTTKLDATAVDADNNATNGVDKYTITVLEAYPGYYFVKDADDSLNNKDDSYTRYILKVADNATVAPKGTYPTVEKKIKENTKAATASYTMGKYTTPVTYNDVADWNINDNVPFELIGTMPTNIGDYDGYYYKFTDTLSKGFTVDSNSFEVVVHTYGENDAETKYKLNVTPTVGDYSTTDGTNITVEIANLKATDLSYYTWADDKWSDAATTGSISIDANTIVTVDYTAVLNENAVIGLDGNPNEVDLTYSNNPNKSGNGSNDDTGKTPKEYVLAFTYELDVTKYLGDDKTLANATDGTKAGFKLQATTGDHANSWAQVDADGKITGWTTDASQATEVTTAANGTFKFVGLDDGTYTLKETTTPSGYNTMADKTLVITAGTVTCQDYMEVDTHDAANEVLTTLKLTVDTAAAVDGDVEKGTVATEIINEKGASLPSTGGIGTTLFYVGGGVLVAGAGVLLITKKRAKKDAE